MISVQTEDFSLSHEYEQLAQGSEAGAVVTFIGKVRDFNQGDSVQGLSLEHYPGMTEKALADIIEQARSRWPLLKVRVIHRVGDLELGDQIVFVGVSSAHRQAAFESCEFIMDFLKTKAPFWKKEQVNDNSRWVDAREADNKATERWQQQS
jgi:molybdopterin synthase catalytic subunit